MREIVVAVTLTAPRITVVCVAAWDCNAVYCISMASIHTCMLLHCTSKNTTSVFTSRAYEWMPPLKYTEVLSRAAMYSKAMHDDAHQCAVQQCAPYVWTAPITHPSGHPDQGRSWSFHKLDKFFHPMTQLPSPLSDYIKLTGATNSILNLMLWTTTTTTTF